MTIGLWVASGTLCCFLLINIVFLYLNITTHRALSWWKTELEEQQQIIIKDAADNEALALRTRELANKDLELATVLFNGVRDSDFSFASVKQYYN